MHICLRAAFLAGLSLPLSAGPGGPGGAAGPGGSVTGTVNRLTKLLSLTSTQIPAATALFTTEATAVETAQASLATEQTALTSAIDAASGITGAITAIETLDTTLLQAEATADAGLYAILSSTQQTTYQTLLTAGLDGFGNFGGGICLGAGTIPVSSTNPPSVATIVADRVARLTSILTLSTGQAAAATSLFTTEVTAVQTAQSGVASAQTGLIMAIESNTGIAAAVSGLAAIDTQILTAQATADAAFYAELSSTQQTIYQQLLAGGLDADATFGPVGGPVNGPGGGGHGNH